MGRTLAVQNNEVDNMKIEQLVRNNISSMADYPAPAIVMANCKLNQNESPYDLPDFIKQQIAERILQTPLNRYYDGTSKQLREKLAKKFSVRPENIIIGCGIDELLYYLALAFVNKGEKIVRPVPSFSMYKICANIAGAKDKAIELNENFELTEELVKESKDAKITFICRPNNPTSNSFDKRKIKKIVKNTSGIVCIDEAYAEFASDNCLDLLKCKNVVIMRTFSKVYSAAAVRLGYAIADKEIVRYMDKIRLPWNVSIISQIAGEIILDNDSYFEQKRTGIISERKRLEKEMRKINGVRVYPSDSNFILFKSTVNTNTLFESLLKKKVLIRSLEKSWLPGFLRVNAGTPEENNIFITALREVAEIDAILFDIDGVLVDVSKSYRLAIQKTAEKFLGRPVSKMEIDLIKSINGFNNDWDATYALVKGVKDRKEVIRESEEYAKIKKEFQRLYLGEFINNEKLLINASTLSQLKQSGLKLGIVTSRPRAEAVYALKSFMPEFFSENSIIAQEDCKEEKPSPKPLLLAKERISAKNPIYVGDSINDEFAAKAAGMIFISVNQKLSADFYVKNVNKILRVIFNGS